MKRVTNWPQGIDPPRRVRVYWRCDHWLLQWWEPKQRKNVAESVDGDLISAVARAREVERRLEQFDGSGHRSGRISHEELVDRFLVDLNARADAGEIEPSSVRRIASALNYYRTFTSQTEISRSYRFVINVDRTFAQQMKAFLAAPRSTAAAKSRPSVLQDPCNVLGAARAMFAWAADPDRGALLPEGFRNPFRSVDSKRAWNGSSWGEPDVTLQMAVEMLRAADAYQLRLLAPILFYGLRAAEPVFLFYERMDDAWLTVGNLPELAYRTKGKRAKKLPLFPLMRRLISSSQRAGLLFLRREVEEQRQVAPLLGRGLTELAEEFGDRCQKRECTTALARRAIRDEVVHDAGGTSYDAIRREFRTVAGVLSWPKQATLKDLRHLFATSMANAAMPEAARQYLLGHSSGRAAIHVYTHVNMLAQQYEAAIKQTMAPALEVLESRLELLAQTQSRIV